MNIVTFLIGLIAIILCGVLLFSSIKRTPKSLRGYYGKYYILLSVLGVICGLVLVLISV